MCECACVQVYLCEKEPEGLCCFLAELLHPPPLHRLHHLEQVRLPQHCCAAVLQELQRTQTQIGVHIKMHNHTQMQSLANIGELIMRMFEWQKTKKGGRNK